MTTDWHLLGLLHATVLAVNVCFIVIPMLELQQNWRPFSYLCVFALFVFVSEHFLRLPSTDVLETFSHDMALDLGQIKATVPIYLNVSLPPEIIAGGNLEILSNSAPNRTLLNVVVT